MIMKKISVCVELNSMGRMMDIVQLVVTFTLAQASLQ